MANSTISQRIALEGADEIRKTLEGIGQAGSKAFAQVQGAVDAANSRLAEVSKAVAGAEAQFAKVQEAGKKVAEQFNNFGSALGSTVARASAFVASATGMAVAALALAKSAANASDELTRNAQATGLTIQQYAGFSKAASQAGVDHEQFVAGMRKFSQDVVESAKKEKEAILGIATEVAKATNKQEEGVFKVQKVADLQQQLEAIKKVAPDVQQALANVGQNISIERVTFELQKLIRSGVDLSDLFAKLGAPLPATNVLDGLKAAAREGDTALQKLGIRTTEFVNGVLVIRSQKDNLLDFAEAFSKLSDGPQKVAIATEALTRTGPQFIGFLNLGRAGMLEMINKFDQFGIKLTEVEILVGQRMNRSLERLGGTISGVKNKIGALFEPIVIEAADAFTQVILENSLALRQLAARAADFVIPIVRDLIAILSGKDGDVKNKWILEARDGIVSFGKAVQGAVLNIIVPAFGALMKVLDTVASGINTVFGTSLTGGQIGIAIVIAQLLGAFRLLATAIVLAIGGVKLLTEGIILAGTAWTAFTNIISATALRLAALALSPVVLTAAFAAAALAIVANWDSIRAALVRFGVDMDGADAKVQQFADFTKNTLGVDLLGGISKFAEDLRSKGIFEALKTDFQVFVDDLKVKWSSFTQTFGTDLLANWRSSGFIAAVTSDWDKFISDLAAKLDRLNGLFRSLPSSGGDVSNPAGDPTGFDRGGFTGSGDPSKIAGFVHREEHVQPAHVVRQPRVLGFLEMLRQSGGDLSGTIARFARGFSAGGLVGGLSQSLSVQALPGFAAGGLVTALASTPARDLGTLTIRDERTGETFSGLTDDAFAEGLARAVNRRRRHSGGRKPSHYGA
jgi:hypothetical protein